MQPNRLRSWLVVFWLAVWTRGPALAQYQVYWGDVHGHTSHSDGKGSLDEFFVYARDVSKLDFAIVTDHDFGNGKPDWRMPKETWTLTQDKAAEYTVDGTFVAIAGYEWTSAAKYWTDVEEGQISERLFPGTPRFYNHKNVYFPRRVEYLLSAKDSASMSPDLLADAVRKYDGLIQNNHPDAGQGGKDQWAYQRANDSVITNTEIGSDTVRYQGKTYQLDWERSVREFLNRGGKTGFVKGTDSHEGRPAARTAVLAKELTTEAVFDALRHRRNYAVTGARIELDFKIGEHEMGEAIEIEVGSKPKIFVGVRGTDEIREVAIVRDGVILYSLNPATQRVNFEYVDDSYDGNSYYYLRVTQVDHDKNGNRSRAWSSPIWVQQEGSARNRP